MFLLADVNTLRTTQMLLPVLNFLSLTLTHVGLRPQCVTRLFLEFFRQVQAGQLKFRL